MRVLLLDVDVASLNPSTRLASPLFRAFTDLVIYGPGFVAPEILSQGLMRFLENEGPFDWVVLGPFAPAFDFSDESCHAWSSYILNYCAGPPNPETLKMFFCDVAKSWSILRRQRVAAWLINFDYYAATPRQIEWLEHNEIYPICPNETFAVADLQERPTVKIEAHYKRKENRISTAWYEYLVSHRDRIFTSLHFVSDDEFVFSSALGRRFDVSIPGVGYALRKEARESVRHCGIRVDRNTDVRLIRLADRVGLRPFRHTPILHLYRRLYQDSLAMTTMAFIAPGGFGIPVRKYFEAPAAGCAVLATPCLGFSELGFREGVNFLPARSEEVGNIAMDNVGNTQLDLIARRGQNLVWEEHSLRARARQMESMMSSALRGTFLGARWENGHFCVETSE